ncbi:glucose-1-phosphate cytidylyltransferase [Sphingosinicella sp. BN140058]|uniref:glucose-1-phosphate cytidylyltransferase n=1 Tax=Sphingosinicella sp. BN140058 TaxID=1892855 RepID=UPI0010126757|nr:glucose-1-phosphate cytidylyltransferase [Sphingosinicella sp. BN140058]QAY77046.1 glucose-1-phosphate cytidylyltransferase [Sphingosinicella sp. BN140058]
MKAIILAGGLGTRLAEETAVRPKPMVEIGGRPIIWHIMKIYSHFGVNDFIVCLGYKGYLIKEYFANYALHMSDVTIDMRKGTTEVHRNTAEDWRISLVDTGDETMTGGRLKRAMSYLGDDDTFCLTYGDGVADIDIAKEIEFHRSHGKEATVAAVRPLSRFGQLDLDGDRVHAFAEKPVEEGGWINGGFFVLSRSVEKYIEGDTTVWERMPLEQLAAGDQMRAYFHDGFWQPMDTLRDRHFLEELWQKRQAPWRVW